MVLQILTCAGKLPICKPKEKQLRGLNVHSWYNSFKIIYHLVMGRRKEKGSSKICSVRFNRPEYRIVLGLGDQSLRWCEVCKIVQDFDGRIRGWGRLLLWQNRTLNNIEYGATSVPYKDSSWHQQRLFIVRCNKRIWTAVIEYVQGILGPSERESMHKTSYRAAIINISQSTQHNNLHRPPPPQCEVGRYM
jgi:hypothetical protein